MTSENLEILSIVLAGIVVVYGAFDTIYAEKNNFPKWLRFGGFLILALCLGKVGCKQYSDSETTRKRDSTNADIRHTADTSKIEALQNQIIGLQDTLKFIKKQSTEIQKNISDVDSNVKKQYEDGQKEKIKKPRILNSVDIKTLKNIPKSLPINIECECNTVESQNFFKSITKWLSDNGYTSPQVTLVGIIMSADDRNQRFTLSIESTALISIYKQQ